jgi:hypothetical protein
MELDTPIVPGAVAIAVLEEASVWLEEALPRHWARELCARARTVYACNERFRRKLRAPGASGRDLLWAFARHWLAALIQERRPHLHRRLPASYSVGHPLPVRLTRAIMRRDVAFPDTQPKPVSRNGGIRRHSNRPARLTSAWYEGH